MPRLLIFICCLLLMACRQQPAPAPESIPEGERVAGVVKLVVSESGLVRVQPSDLQQAGIELDTFGDVELSLTDGGEIVPVLINGDDLLFYGRASDNRYTPVRTYLLRIGVAADETSPAMVEIQGENQSVSAETTLQRVFHLEENHIYKSNARTRASDTPPWFWEMIRVESSVDVSFELPPLTEAPASLQIQVWGATTDVLTPDDHDVGLILNGQNLGTLRGDGETFFTGDFAIAEGVLNSGENVLTLDNTPEGATFLDISYLDWLSLTAPIPSRADSDRVEGIAVGTGQVSLEGFSGMPILFNLNAPSSPAVYSGWESDRNEAAITLKSGDSILAVGPEGFLSPDQILPLRTTNLDDRNNRADLIIISTRALIPSLEPLILAREEQGLSVIAADIEEIYDRFGHGQATPTGIQSFLGYAIDSWQQPSPQYLLIVGDASYDFRGYLGPPPDNLIPSVMVPVAFSGETISDVRLADVDGDFRADIAVGRWTATSPDEVAGLVERTLAYESNEAIPQALFAADGSSQEFTSFTDSLIEGTAFPEGQTNKLYGVDGEAIRQAWNDGAWLVTYTGHGSTRLWGKDELFSIEQVASLNTSQMPIVLQFTCLTGFFADPEVQSLTEALLLHPQGPVLLIGASSLTLSTAQAPFARDLLTALQNPEVRHMGDALQAAKQNLDVELESMREINDTFMLFGDPSARIIRPHLPTATNAP